MPGAKRTAEPPADNGSKRQRLLNEGNSIRRDVFSEQYVKKQNASYLSSKPSVGTLDRVKTPRLTQPRYKHGVIQDLIEPGLLRKVRNEIQENISFTPKETDIYKIHQSGDLANLNGIDDESLARLPSLLALRDNLYSAEFRRCISEITGAGPLSGRKTDMAVNVYTPGCHLLCHDDVIGSRRISYILYMTDPDKPWNAEWGGALRLYPTEECEATDGSKMKVPSPDFTVSIPPAFNQLAFFAVQPGESFHDVEEVYMRRPDSLGVTVDERVRMAISGWYHIPQKGEEGFEQGLEEKLAEKSSLTQLQGRAEEFDLPQAQWRDYQPSRKEVEGGTEALDEYDLELLIRFMTPQYLTPDTVEELSDRFMEDSSLQLADFLSPKFSERLKSELMELEKKTDQEKFRVARPPHKHRFMYQQPGKEEGSGPLHDVIHVLLPSMAFKKWLQMVTGDPDIGRNNVLARRFRRGQDYTLATSYDDPDPRIELCLGITPSHGWGGDETTSDHKEAKVSDNGDTNGSAATSGTEEDNFGGYEVYMAGDEEEDDPNENGEETSTMTGAGKRRKADPAIYRAANIDEGDGVLFTNPASWNTMSIVLRDRGVLRFVKYVSQSAPGDRWDVLAEYEISGWPEDDDDDDDDDEEGSRKVEKRQADS